MCEDCIGAGSLVWMLVLNRSVYLWELFTFSEIFIVLTRYFLASIALL